MYVRPGLVIVNDGYTFGIINIICKRSFGTMSLMCARHQPIEIFRRDSPINLAKKWSDYIQVVKEESEARDSDKSLLIYASIRARCSNIWKGSMTSLNALQNPPKEQNVSFTKLFGNLASVLKIRDIESFLKGMPYEKNVSIYKSLPEHDTCWRRKPKKSDALVNAESVRNGLKSSTTPEERKNSPQLLEWRKEKVTHPALEETSWIDRVVEGHKTSLQNMKSAGDNGRVNVKNNEISKSSKEVNTASLKNPLWGDEPSISEYINRGPVNEDRKMKSTTSQNIIGGSYGTKEEPKVELRMSSTQNESVVSINVDSITNRGPTNTRELSVIVQSNKDVAANRSTSDKVLTASPTLQKSLESNFQNTRSNLNSMRISINEDSVPVKQIQFAINGKPVSQLKSIIARSSQLDVVTSVDKIEIRVPFAKDKTRLAVDQSKVMMQGATSPNAVLNLQISANFDETQPSSYGYTPYKTEVKPTPDSPSPPGNPLNPAKTSGSNEKRDYTFLDNTVDASIDNFSPPSDPILMRGKQSMNISLKNPRLPESSREINPDNENGNQSDRNASGNEARTGLRVNKATFTKEENQDRTPSNTIPWWASDDAFNRVEKKRKNDSSSDVHSKKSRPLERLENIEDSNRLLKSSAVPFDKSNKFPKSTSSFPPKRGSNSNKYRKRQSSERKPVKPTGNKRSGFNWQKVPDMVQNVDGVSIKLKEKLDHDTIHVQDQLKINGSKTNVPNIKAKDPERILDAEEKSKIFHRDSVIVKTTPPKPNTSEMKEDIKLQEKKPTNEIGIKSLNKQVDANQAKQEKKTDNIFLSDSAVKSFMDAMKPIEKREDGTLIDFGMKVSSRRMPEKQNSDIHKIRTKITNMEKIKPLSTASNKNVGAKISTKNNKILHVQQKSESSRNSQKVVEDTKSKLSSKHQVIDTKGNTDRSNIAEKKVLRSTTTDKNIDGAEKSSTLAVESSTNSVSPEKADTIKSSVGTEKKSAGKNHTVRSLQSPVQSEKWRLNSMRASSESILRDSSRIPVAPKKTVEENNSRTWLFEKKVATFSVEKKMASAAASLRLQTSVRNSPSIMTNKVGPSEKAVLLPTTSADENSAKEKKTGTDSPRLAGTVTDQSLKRVAELITKRENTQEGSSNVESFSDFESNADINNFSGSVFPKLAINVEALKRCKSNSLSATKTGSETGNQKSSKQPTKKEKPTCVNRTT